MTDATYQDRQNLEFFRWPELAQKFQSHVELVMVAPGNLSRQLRSELFTMASIAGGCRHCQAHGAYTLHMMGVAPDRIRDRMGRSKPRGGRLGTGQTRWSGP